MSSEQQVRTHHVMRAVIDMNHDKKSHLRAMARIMANVTGEDYDTCAMEIIVLAEELIVERGNGQSFRIKTKMKLDALENAEELRKIRMKTVSESCATCMTGLAEIHEKKQIRCLGSGELMYEDDHCPDYIYDN